MKKTFVFTIAICAALLSAYQSKAQLTIKGGFNFASISANATEQNLSDYSNSSITGYQLGLAVPLNIGSGFSIQPEFLWIQKGGKLQYTINSNNNLVSTTTYNYGEIPVLLKLRVGSTTGNGLGFYIVAGPAVGLAFNGKYKTETTIAGSTATTSEKDISFDNTAQNYQNRVDWSGIAGIGVTVGSIVFDARYDLGFTNLINTGATSPTGSPTKQRNRGIGLTVGYQF